MKHPVSRELFSYWDHLRRGRAAPERAEIDPAAIRRVLSDTFILGIEHTTAGVALPIRLSGTRLNALFLSELKGRSLLDLWDPIDKPSVGRLFETVLDDVAPVVAGLRSAAPGHRPIDLEMILLPLRHQGRTHARILGAIAPFEPPGWLGLAGLRHLSLTSLRLIDPQAPGVALRRVNERVSLPSADQPRQVGRFVVHQGGR